MPSHCSSGPNPNFLTCVKAFIPTFNHTSMSAPLPPTEHELRTLLEDRAAAIRAKDAARATAPYAPNTMMFVLTPPLQPRLHDHAPDQSGVTEWFASFQGPIDCESRDLRITTSPETAFAHQLLHISGIQEGGKPANYWIRETLGFRHLDGRWQITHQHQSVPLYLDGSGRAALDLKP